MFGLFGEDAAVAPSAFSQIGSAITGAVTGLATQFPGVATNVLTAKATEAATNAQAKLAAAEAKKIAAETARIQALQTQSATAKTIKQESKWAVPLLIGGGALLGFALWMRSKKR